MSTLPAGCGGSEPFALQVTGDDMAPEFPRDCVIIVEPSGVAEHGAFVVAETDNGVVLRKLIRSEGSWWLTTPNGDQDKQPLQNIESIKGRVIQRAGRTRKERKSYL